MLKVYWFFLQLTGGENLWQQEIAKLQEPLKKQTLKEIANVVKVLQIQQEIANSFSCKRI